MSEQQLTAAPTRAGAAAHEVMLRHTGEALQHGRSTLVALEKQDELLTASEQNLDSNEHIIQQSMRVVRGMTWAGYFYNMVHSEPSLDGKANRKVDSRPTSGRAPATGSGNQDAAASPESNLQRKGELLAGSAEGAPPSAAHSKRQQQDAALDAVSRGLAELHDISVVMGESLEAQNGKLDALAAKTDKVNDATLEVLLKSSQLIERNSSIIPLFMGEFCFEVHTGGYLAVQDEMLVIGAPIADLSTTFRCFSKGENIFGMLSARTMKYVATGYFTPVSVSGVKFNRAAQMYIDLSGEYNGLLMLSCNWGYGGWLKFSGDSSSDFKLTSGLRDKDNRVLVRAVPLGKREKGHS